MIFPADLASINAAVAQIDPARYGKTRNFIDGAVTRLSPYISRGVISTRQVMQSVLQRGYKPYQVEKFLQELGWRDYWQQVWVAKGDAINSDLKQPQQRVAHNALPQALAGATTEIDAIDSGLRDLYETGYMHNHLRMYTAALACNVGGSHWHTPAQWMYYHLVDGDWASNALSWQWVAGTNSSKRYFANQENINRYCHTQQQHTYLDVDYARLVDMPVPAALQITVHPTFKTLLPLFAPLQIDPNKPTMVYNSYQLDPN